MPDVDTIQLAIQYAAKIKRYMKVAYVGF